MLTSTLALFVYMAAPTAQAQPSPEILARSTAAQEAFSAGRFEEAAALYGELAKALPDIPGLKMNWGMAQYLAGRPAQAVEPLRLAVEGDANLVPAWFFLGVSLLETGRVSDAVAPLQEYVKRSPSEIKGIEALGDALLRTGSAEPALAQYKRATELDPRSAQAWFGLGRSYEALAGRSFEQLNQAAPESGYWLALIAESRVAQQQNSSGFFFYREALKRQPALRGVHTAIAQIYRKTDHLDWADQEESKEAALGAPDCAREPYDCLFLSGKMEDLFSKVRTLATPEGYYWQIKVYNQLAIKAFKRLDELPPSVESYQFRAQNQRNLNRHWESVNLLRKALELDPGHPVVQRELALSLYLNRDYETAKALVHQLLQSDPDSPVLNFLAGDIRLYQQNVEECIPFLEKSVRLDASYIGVHSALGRAYMHVGEAAKAIPHLKAALARDDDGSLHYQLARAYQRTGQAELARETMGAYQKLKRELEAQQTAVEDEVKITPP